MIPLFTLTLLLITAGVFALYAVREAFGFGQRYRTGSLLADKMKASGDTRTGACGPPQAPSLRSWGAGCPPGNCTSEDLATNLNRQFAGERYGCRELTYWIKMTIAADGTASFSDNAKVTICPTRVILMAPGVLTPTVLLSEFTIGNQNQMVGDPIPFQLLDVTSYQAIPFVTDCIKAGLPFAVKLSGAAANSGVQVYFGIIGPAVG